METWDCVKIFVFVEFPMILLLTKLYKLLLPAVTDLLVSIAYE